MKVDNFPLIKDLLVFDSEDDFYYLQLIQRRNKVNLRGTCNKNRVVRTYYIKSADHLDKVEDEIKGMADYFNARAGINLNRRSFEECAFYLLRDVSEYLCKRDYAPVRNVYNSVCGKHSKKGDKKWIVDVDEPVRLNKVIQAIEQCRPDGDKVIATLPTSAGYHVITSPFDVGQYTNIKDCHEDIHKNNPAALYYPE